jgi:hypothetical protein
MAPARTCSRSGSGVAQLPLPRKPRFIGNASAASSMRCRFQRPGEQVVALVPVAGPVPPPSIVVTPLASASGICCGQMKWMWVSMPPAVTMQPSAAMTSVAAPMTMGLPPKAQPMPLWMSGLPAWPMPTMRPPFTPMSALITPSRASRISALVSTRSRQSASQARADWPMPSRITLPPPNFTSLP